MPFIFTTRHRSATARKTVNKMFNIQRYYGTLWNTILKRCVGTLLVIDVTDTDYITLWFFT